MFALQENIVLKARSLPSIAHLEHTEKQLEGPQLQTVTHVPLVNTVALLVQLFQVLETVQQDIIVLKARPRTTLLPVIKDTSVLLDQRFKSNVMLVITRMPPLNLSVRTAQ